MQHKAKTVRRNRLPWVLAGMGVAAGVASAQLVEQRPIDGVGNNVAYPFRGSSEQPLIRKAPIAYADGYQAPSGQDRPNPRLITLLLCQQDGPIPAKRDTSDYLWAFGVFVNHDMDITEGAEPMIPMNIPIPANDPYFDPTGSGVQEIPFSRGKTIPGTGTGPDNPLQLDNSDTAFLDLSTVYGSDPERAAWLRTGVGGKMKTTPHPTGDLLPYNDGTQFNLGNFELSNYSTELFLAGDVRCNVSAFLATMHTVFVRNHNWWAEQYAEANPALTDEELYQQARRRNIAELEHIVFYEWLPALLGGNAVPAYSGYNANVDPSCAVEFTTVILRSVGHTLLPTEILRLEEDGTPSAAGNILLRDSFFDNAPLVIQSAGIDPILRGLAAKRCQESDVKFVDDIHHFLFTLPGAGGRDLVALNIQRARDFGLPDYNTLREAYGLSRKTSFSQITSNRQLAASLEALYGSVDNIDPFIGAVCEDHYGAGSVGELIHFGMLDQFNRLREGDRFWFEAPGNFSEGELEEIYATKLSDIIKRNSGAQSIQKNVFFVPRPTRPVFGFGQAAGATETAGGFEDTFFPGGLCGALGAPGLIGLMLGMVTVRGMFRGSLRRRG